MNGAELIESLRTGRRAYGTLIVSDSPRWLTVIGEIGLDFVFIDTEHVAIDRRTLSWMCVAYGASGLCPLVRIPSPDPFEATKVLDGGAGGVIAPYVETAGQVRALAGAVKLRPVKGRRLAGMLEGREQPEPDLAEYLAGRNAASALIVNIESVPAMENLHEILAVEQLDAVLIGPHDLSCSLGIPERYDHPDFDRAVREIITAARAAGKGAGIHYWADIEQEIGWARDDGANLILHAADVIAFRDRTAADVARLREALGDARSGGKGDVSI